MHLLGPVSGVFQRPLRAGVTCVALSVATLAFVLVPLVPAGATQCGGADGGRDAVLPAGPAQADHRGAAAGTAWDAGRTGAGLWASVVTGTGQATEMPAAVYATQTAGGPPGLSLVHAVVLGIVEGVTEYLPVSSTGHLLVAEQALGISGNADLKKASDAYAICIQFGAILAVLVLYWGRFVSIVKGIFGRDPIGRRLSLVLLASFVPAAIIGVLGESLIKEYLFAVWPIVGAWIVGGLVILVVARLDTRRGRGSAEGMPMERLTAGRAVVIGLLQCVAMWPGVSRSLATILGGRLVGLSTAAAVEYSFLLGLVTLTAATVYSTVKDGALIVETLGIVAPIVGVVVAFVSAAVAVKWMVAYLNRHSLAVFGWYRIALGAVVAGLVLLGVL